MSRPFFTHTTISDDSALGGKEIERSLRFNGSDTTAHLTRTPSTSGNRKVWTFSAWIKIAHTDAGPNYIYAANNGNTSYVALYFRYNKLYTYFHPNNNYGEVSDRLFRDVGSWFHVVHQVDAGDFGQKIWINGEALSLNSGRNPANNDYGWNQSGVAQRVGNASWRNDNIDGYLADVFHIDGQLKFPSDFGFTEFQTGIWRPKKYEGTYGTNGFHLDFSDNSAATAATIGKDRSGNGNDFTPNNLSVSAGTGNDSLEDTPTNNFCTLNSLDQKNTSIQNGNLTVTQASDPARIRGTFSMRPDTGKWYYEMQVGSGSSYVFGMKSISATMDSITEDYGYYGYNGHKNVNGSSSSYGASYSAGDTVAILYDSDKHTVNFYKNNADQGQITGVSATTEYLPWVYLDNYGTAPNVHFNFGQRPFTYTPPTGFKTLCSNNLSPNVPPIIKPQKHFECITYTPNSGSLTVDGLEFTPDLIWLKSRTQGYRHYLFDSVRGTGQKALSSDLNVAEGNDAGTISSFNNGGFSIPGSSGFNDNGSGANGVVAWCWKAGGAAVSNTDGTITSQVSANTEAGFSIITYTGTGADGTIGHGLGKTPSWVITKKRSGTQNWLVKHSSAGAGKVGYLDLSDPFDTTGSGGGIISDFSSSSTYTVTRNNSGSDNYGNVNASGETYVAYCWSEIPGFSKFGRYTGNGNDNGTFVFTGFRPAWIMIKMTSGSDDWPMYDNKRDPFNVGDHRIFADTSGVEGAVGQEHFDFVSNGIKFRKNKNPFNNSGSTYIYMAFAEQPGITPYDTQTNAR